MKAGKKEIEIRAGMSGRQLIASIKNTYENQVICKDGAYTSTKHSGVGMAWPLSGRLSRNMGEVCGYPMTPVISP